MHKHPRVFVDGKISLRSLPEESDKLADEFVIAIRQTLTNMRLVDKNCVIDSRNPGEHPFISIPEDLPLNQTLLSRYVAQGEKTEFKRQKPWQKGTLGDEEDGLINPSVFYTLAIKCDKAPEEILERVKAEYMKMGGEFLKVKNIESFKPKAFVRVFRTHNYNPTLTRTYELGKILLEARQAESAADKHYKWGSDPIASFQQRSQVPQIVGVSSKMFEHWPENLKANRKLPHFECDIDKVEQMQSLVEMGKKHRLFEKYWGKGVHVSCVHEYQKLTSAQNTALKDFSKKHVEIQNSYEMDYLSGIAELGEPVPVRDVNDSTKTLGHISLRQVLYRYYMITDKIAGDISMFWEIHQGGDFMDVDVVRPKDDEAQHALVQMNKNLAAYLFFSLKEKQVAQNFIDDLIHASIDVTLVREVSQCRWDTKKKTLWTPRDEEEEAKKRQEQASWYVRLDMLDIGNKKSSSKEVQADRRNLLKISDINSVATLNAAEGEKDVTNEDPSSKGYTGDPGLPVLSLGKAKAPGKPMMVTLTMRRRKSLH